MGPDHWVVRLGKRGANGSTRRDRDSACHRAARSLGPAGGEGEVLGDRTPRARRGSPARDHARRQTRRRSVCRRLRRTDAKSPDQFPRPADAGRCPRAGTRHRCRKTRARRAVNWLLDTNVISETTKRKPSSAVLAWVAAQPLETLYTASL